MRQNSLMTGMALGALLGGATALFLSPKSGKENLRSLKSGVGAVRHKAMTLVSRRNHEERPDPADSGKEDYLY
jgi:gas vesicle protein